MKKYSSIFEAWTLEIRGFSEAWLSALDAFALSCLLAFLILISVPVFSHRSVPPHLGDSAHPIRLSTKTSQLSTAFKVNQAWDSSENPSKFEKIKVNQGKSNQFKVNQTSFFITGPHHPPNWVHDVDHRPSRWSNLGFKAVLKGFKVI
jgi:hypothetical protein